MLIKLQKISLKDILDKIHKKINTIFDEAGGNELPILDISFVTDQKNEIIELLNTIDAHIGNENTSGSVYESLSNAFNAISFDISTNMILINMEFLYKIFLLVSCGREWRL